MNVLERLTSYSRIAGVSVEVEELLSTYDRQREMSELERMCRGLQAYRNSFARMIRQINWNYSNGKDIMDKLDYDPGPEVEVGPYDAHVRDCRLIRAAKLICRQCEAQDIAIPEALEYFLADMRPIKPYFIDDGGFVRSLRQHTVTMGVTDDAGISQEGAELEMAHLAVKTWDALSRSGIEAILSEDFVDIDMGQARLSFFVQEHEYDPDEINRVVASVYDIDID